MSDTESFAATTATRQELTSQDKESTAPEDSDPSLNGHAPAETNGIETPVAPSTKLKMPAPEIPHVNAEANASVSSADSDESLASTTLAEITLSQLDSLRAYHNEVVEGQPPEAVHKMRVTTRRLQASLDLLQSNGDEFQIRKLKKQLRKWRRVLSLVRNYDVFLNLIEKETSGRKPHAKKRFEMLRSVIEERRAHTADKSSEYLKNINIEKLAARLGLAEKESSEQQEKKNLMFDERRITRRAAERLEQRLAEFLSLALQAHPTSDPADLHQLRIAAKRLRYLLETVSEMGMGDASKALSWLRSIQDRIGDWHDLQAIEEEIISIAARRRFMSENLSRSIQMLQAAAHLKKKKEKFVSRLFPVRVPRTITVTSLRLAKSLRRLSA